MELTTILSGLDAAVTLLNVSGERFSPTLSDRAQPPPASHPTPAPLNLTAPEPGSAEVLYSRVGNQLQTRDPQPDCRRPRRFSARA